MPDKAHPRIVAAEVFRLAHAVRAVRAHGIGEISDRFETVFLALVTEDGRTGWGEAAPWAPFAGTSEASVAALARYMAPAFIGAETGQTDAIMTRADQLLAGHPDAKAALETALLDLHGQCSGKPIWALLGEKRRDRLPLSISIADPVWERDLDLIARAHAAGIRILKFKAGFAEAAFDHMRIDAVASRWPDMRLRVDYNQGLSPDQALEQVPALDGLGLDFIEQPVRAKEWAAMAALTRATTTPILADESVFDAHDLRLGHRDGIADAVSIKIFKTGGPLRAHRLAAQAQTLGWPVYGGDMFETGVAHLAGMHMIAASDGFDWGCEFYHANWHLKRDTLATRFPEEDGAVIVPDAPGLGVAVDADRIRKTALETIQLR